MAARGLVRVPLAQQADGTLEPLVQAVHEVVIIPASMQNQQHINQVQNKPCMHIVFQKKYLNICSCVSYIYDVQPEHFCTLTLKVVLGRVPFGGPAGAPAGRGFFGGSPKVLPGL